MIEISRHTKETSIKVSLELYGEGKSRISTPAGFFNHMLETLAKHSGINLDIEAIGDIDVDMHHTIEAIGITLGEAFLKALKTNKNLRRFGFSVTPMDDALILSSVDLCNRIYLGIDISLSGSIGTFDCELVEEFFRALTANARFVLHIKQLSGFNRHHICEAIFKSVAHSLKMAVSSSDSTKSTKGILY